MIAKHWFTNRFVSFCMCAIFMATAAGCSSASPASSSLHAQYSGETLFRAIYFGQGEVAKAFPEVWELKAFAPLHHLTPEQAVRLDKFVAAIDAKYPGLFDRFAVEIQSGDHLRVQAAMLEGAADMSSLISNSTPGDLRDECICINTGLIFGYYVAVAVAAVAVEAAFYFVAVDAQVTVNQTVAINTNSTVTTSTATNTSASSSIVTSCGSSCGSSCESYHGGGGDVAIGEGKSDAAPAPSPAPSSEASPFSNPSLFLDEYVDLIALRLALVR
jgi:SdpC family antimicrobial peptide